MVSDHPANCNLERSEGRSMIVPKRKLLRHVHGGVGETGAGRPDERRPHLCWLRQVGENLTSSPPSSSLLNKREKLLERGSFFTRYASEIESDPVGEYTRAR